VITILELATTHKEETAYRAAKGFPGDEAHNGRDEEQAAKATKDIPENLVKPVIRWRSDDVFSVLG